MRFFLIKYILLQTVILFTQRFSTRTYRLELKLHNWHAGQLVMEQKIVTYTLEKVKVYAWTYFSSMFMGIGFE